MNALDCIACGRKLSQVSTDAGENQPYCGTAFRTHGHYGSTAFDPMDGHYLVINVCDLCLVTHTDRVWTGRDGRPTMEEGVVTGWEKVNWKAVPWHPDAKSFEHVIERAREEFSLVEEDDPDEVS